MARTATPIFRENANEFMDLHAHTRAEGTLKLYQSYISNCLSA